MDSDDITVHYVLRGTYPEDVSKDKKRAARKRAANLVVERGEVLLFLCYNNTVCCLYLNVVCHGLGNLISCLDDIIVMLRSDWPTSERVISRAGWRVYEVRFTGVGMH